MLDVVAVVVALMRLMLATLKTALRTTPESLTTALKKLNASSDNQSIIPSLGSLAGVFLLLLLLQYVFATRFDCELDQNAPQDEADGSPKARLNET